MLLFLLNAAVAGPVTTSGWSLQRWHTDDGLPLAHLNDVAQTDNGFVWLATFDGLVRFDGLSFTTFRSGSLPGLPEDRIVDLHPRADDHHELLVDQMWAAGDERLQQLSVQGLYGEPVATEALIEAVHSALPLKVRLEAIHSLGATGTDTARGARGHRTGRRAGGTGASLRREGADPQLRLMDQST